MITVVFGTTTLYVGCLVACQILHDSMLKTIMHAKMSFFNVTPIGRILNRVSKDVDIIDITLPPILLSWNRCLIMVSVKDNMSIVSICTFEVLNTATELHYYF